LAERLPPKSLTGFIYPDDSRVGAGHCDSCQEYFLVALSLADLVRRFAKKPPTGGADGNGRNHSQRHPPSFAVAGVMRIRLDAANLDGTRLGLPENDSPTRTILSYTESARRD